MEITPLIASHRDSKQQHQAIPDSENRILRPRGRYSLLAAWALMILVGGWLGVRIYTDAHMLDTQTRELTNNGVPELETLAALRRDIAGVSPILYHYYADPDDPNVPTRWLNTSVAVDRHLRRLMQHFPGDLSMKGLSEDIKAIQAEATLLFEALAPGRRNWDRSRKILARIRPRSESSNTHLDSLTDEIIMRTNEQTRQAREATNRVSTLAAAYVLSLLLLMLTSGLVIRAFVRSLRERERLTLFAEHNPNPVLRLDGNGHLQYANPSAQHDASALSTGNTQVTPSDFLPADLHTRLKEARKSENAVVTWTTRRD